MINWKLNQEYPFSEGLVRYNVIGDGLPVVLVHGTPWSSFTWHRLSCVLAQHFRVYLYDLIGYGQSEKRDNQNVSLAIQNQLLSQLLDHWNLNSPYVVAHDFGGATTLRAHLLDNCDFKKMVLINVVAMAPWGSPFFAHVQKHESAFSGIPAYIHKAIVETYIQGALFGELQPDEFAALVNPWLGDAGQAAFYRQIAQASQRYTDEVESNYANIRCPVRILWGEEDEWIPIATGRRLHSVIPHSEFYPVPNAGHLAQLDAPETIARQVQEFFAN